MNDNEKRRKAADALKEMADDDNPAWLLPPCLCKMLGFEGHYDAADASAEGWATLAEMVAPQLPDGVEWPRFEDGEPIKEGDEAVFGLIEHKVLVVSEVIFSNGKAYIRDTGSAFHNVIGPVMRPEPPDAWERIEEDAAKGDLTYWGCKKASCNKCPAKVDGNTDGGIRMDSVKIGEVRPFPGVEPNKAQALKPLEEAAEVFGAWQEWDKAYVFEAREANRLRVLSEIADVIQACANLAAALDADDLRFSIDMCERRNKHRGRYGAETPEEYAEDLKACCDEVERRYPNAMRFLEER